MLTTVGWEAENDDQNQDILRRRSGEEKGSGEPHGADGSGPGGRRSRRSSRSSRQQVAGGDVAQT